MPVIGPMSILGETQEVRIVLYNCGEEKRKLAVQVQSSRVQSSHVCVKLSSINVMPCGRNVKKKNNNEKERKEAS